ncbi:MAG TPA: type II and III secretion system protein family protein [Stellaceae bacterium]|nr:type II and III secretion system protein family protein [Stellaceae bacterium]
MRITMAPVAHSHAQQIPANGRPIVLETGKGTLLRLERPASTVFVANPAIADVQVKSPTLIYVTAKAPGETVIYAVDVQDQVLLNSPVRVTHDLSQLRRAIAALVPGQPVTVSSVGSDLVVSGMVASAGQAERVQTLVDEVKHEFKDASVIDHLAIATPNQVNLHVRIAEISRSVIKEFGINWTKLGTTIANPVTGALYPNTLEFRTQNPADIIPPNSITFGRVAGQAVSAELDALAQDGYVTELAEPNLTAMSGQTASFLVGGEFPVPIVQGGAAGTAASVTISFKKYGVSLAFTPTIIDAAHINLRVQPKVSELSTQGEVTLNGFVIQGLTDREADTTVELGSGESFALAGLLQNTSTQTITKVPGLGDIPILGALFRSNQFQRGESELVVIVTPYLVNPVATRLADPLDGFRLPHDMQRVIDSSTYRQQLPAPARGPLGAGGRGLIGPAGFQLD